MVALTLVYAFNESIFFPLAREKSESFFSDECNKTSPGAFTLVSARAYVANSTQPATCTAAQKATSTDVLTLLLR